MFTIRKPILLLLISIVLLYLPLLILIATGAELNFDNLSLGYLALTPIMVLWRANLKNYGGFGNALGMIAYLIAILTALGTSIPATPNTLLVVCFGVAAIIYLLSGVERLPVLIYLSVSFFYLGIAQLVSAMNWTGGAEAALMLTAGIFIYATGYYVTQSDPQTGLILRLSGLSGPFLGSLLGRISDAQTTLALAAFAGGNGLIWIEAWHARLPRLFELAGAITVATLDLSLLVNHVGELQAYTLPWAAYFAYMLTYRKPESLERAIYLGMALAALTLPIAVESAGTGGLIYGVELIFLGFLIAIIGATQQSLMAVWWGWGTALISGLYTLPEYILPGDNIPVIAASLGLVVFSILVIVRVGREP